MKNEIMKVLALVEEMKAEEKKTTKVPVYFKRNGKMIRRSYDDRVYTERYQILFYKKEGEIRENKVFKCACCGEMVDYFELAYNSDYEGENVMCESCYDDEMGEDL